MKKTTIIAVIIGICAMLLAACGTKDKGNPEEIIGVWSQEADDHVYHFSFFSDGTCEFDNFDKAYKFGTWTYEKGEYIIHLNNMNDANTSLDGGGYIDETGRFITWTTDKDKAVAFERVLPYSREYAENKIQNEMPAEMRSKVNVGTYQSIMEPIVGAWSDGKNHLSIRHAAGSVVWYNDSVDPETYLYRPGQWTIRGVAPNLPLIYPVFLYTENGEERYIAEWDEDADTLSLYMESAPTIKTVYHREG